MLGSTGIQSVIDKYNQDGHVECNGNAIGYVRDSLDVITKRRSEALEELKAYSKEELIDFIISNHCMKSMYFESEI